MGQLASTCVADAVKSPAAASLVVDAGDCNGVLTAELCKVSPSRSCRRLPQPPPPSPLPNAHTCAMLAGINAYFAYSVVGYLGTGKVSMQQLPASYSLLCHLT